MPTLTKADIALRLSEAVFHNKRDAKEMVDLIFEKIRETLEQGEEVKLSGFGNFRVRKKAARPGRNPKTGEEVLIASRKVVTFRPGSKLMDRVEQYSGKTSSRRKS